MDIEFIGKRITELRLKKGISEYKMSYDLGHNKNYIRAITSNRSLPSVEGLFSIIEYFGMSPAEFFDTDYDHSQKQMIKKAVEYMKELDDENMLLLLNIIQMFYQTRK